MVTLRFRTQHQGTMKRVSDGVLGHGAEEIFERDSPFVMAKFGQGQLLLGTIGKIDILKHVILEELIRVGQVRLDGIGRVAAC